MAITDGPRGQLNSVPRASDLSVWRTANQMLKQYPETSCLVAAQRADKAYAAGQMFNFRFWGRVANALAELLRQRDCTDTMN
jgi:hypothetical protein